MEKVKVLDFFKPILDEDDIGPIAYINHILCVCDDYGEEELLNHNIMLVDRTEENGRHHDSCDYTFVIRDLMTNKLYQFEIHDNGSIGSSALTMDTYLTEVKVKNVTTTTYIPINEN